MGALVGRAAAVAEAQGAASGYSLLMELPEARFVDYQPYWALKGHLQEALGDRSGAEQSLLRAADSSRDAAETKSCALEPPVVETPRASPSWG